MNWRQIKEIVNHPLVNRLVTSILVSAIVSGFVTYYFNSKLDRNQSYRQYIYNFNRIFFDEPKYRNISIAIEEQYLYNNGLIMKRNGGLFTDYEVDDYINLINELYLYGDKDFLSFDLLDYQFNYYLCITYQNQEIRNYIRYLEGIGFTEPFGHTMDDFAEKLTITEQTDCKLFEE